MKENPAALGNHEEKRERKRGTPCDGQAKPGNSLTPQHLAFTALLDGLQAADTREIKNTEGDLQTSYTFSCLYPAFSIIAGLQISF